MQTLRMAFASLTILALVVGMTGVALAQADAMEDASADEPTSLSFPTGHFVSVDNGRWMLKLVEGGTMEWSDVWGNGWFHAYAVDDDLVTWSVAPFHSLSEAAGGPRHYDDATYRWDYDGERLAFELIGEDPSDGREALLARTFQPIEDPTVVMVATFDLDAGDPIRAWEAYVPAAEVGPDAYTSKVEYLGHVAAVPIMKGQPITPDVVTATE